MNSETSHSLRSGLELRATTSSWDSQPRLRSAANDAASLFADYAADGERVRRNGWPQSFGLFDGANGTVHTPGLAQRKDGIDRLFLSDHLGSTRYLTDATGGTSTLGQRFDAFGNRSALAGTDPPDMTRHGYAGAWGYETEEGLGLQYLYQRYYDPAVGRFLSRDPIGWAGGLNLYGYCENDPVGWVDPSGLVGGPMDYRSLQAVHGHKPEESLLAGIVRGWQAFERWRLGNRAWVEAKAPWLARFGEFMDQGFSMPGPGNLGTGAVTKGVGALKALPAPAPLKALPARIVSTPFKDPKLCNQVRKVVDNFDTYKKPPPGVAQGMAKGGKPGQFLNKGGGLPVKSDPDYYTETDVWERVPGVGRGPERLVLGKGGEVYYTRDHYRSFVRLR